MGAGAGSLPPALYEVVLSRSTSPFVAIDPLGTITFVSGSISRISQWQASELLGRNMVDLLGADQTEKAVEALGEISTGGRYRDSLPIVFTLTQPDNEPIWCEVGAVYLEDTDFDGILLRLQPWTHQQHFDHFLASLLGAAPLEEVCAHLCRSIATHLNATAALIHHGFDGTAFRRTDGASALSDGLPGNIGPWVQAATGHIPVVIGVDELPEPTRSAASEAGVDRVWSIPVPTVDGVQPAVLTVLRSDRLDPMLGHRLAIERHTRHVQLALQRWAEHQRLVHMAGHDALTGVANRSSFRDRMAEAVAIGESDMAVAFCDLDDFKRLNDTFGHPAGDQVLIQVVERLRQALPVGAVLARIGGDEFTILLRDVADVAAAQHLADRLLAAMATPIVFGGRSYPVGMSVGIARMGHDLSADEVLARADSALYEAKRRGGNRSHVVG